MTWRKGQGVGGGNGLGELRASAIHRSVQDDFNILTTSEALTPAECQIQMSALLYHMRKVNLILILYVPQDHLGSLLKAQMPSPHLKTTE